jgi:hypothetical protein
VAYRAAAHALALRLHTAEARHGRHIWRVRVCPDCGKLRAIAAIECGRCEMYVTLWTRHGCDYVIGVE